MPEQDEPERAIPLSPPHVVFLVDDEGEPVLKPLRRVEDLPPNTIACIRNPWRVEEFAKGTVRGEPGAVVLDLGISLGALELDEEHGWLCPGLVKKQSVFAGLAEEMVDQATEANYTQELMKKLKG